MIKVKNCDVICKLLKALLKLGKHGKAIFKTTVRIIVLRYKSNCIIASI